MTDEELLSELKRRFETQNRALNEQVKMMKELEFLNLKLKESEKIKTQFISNIRNELLNPISSLMVLTSHISECKPEQIDEIQKMSKLVHHEVKSLNFQIENIFTAAELESGDLNLELGKVNTIDLINDCIKSFDQEVSKKKIKVTFSTNSLRDGEEYFFTDAHKLGIILRNLLDNAIKFNNDQGQVQVEMTRENGAMQFAIQDSGIGIEKASQERIFDRFRQLDHGSTKNYAGHGLGLTIAQELVASLEGTLQVKSEKGKGATFSFTLPELEPPQTDEFSVDSENELFFHDVEKF